MYSVPNHKSIEQPVNLSQVVKRRILNQHKHCPSVIYLAEALLCILYTHMKYMLSVFSITYELSLIRLCVYMYMNKHIPFILLSDSINSGCSL